MEETYLELKIANRLKNALVNSDLTIKLNDSWFTGQSKRIYDIVVYDGVHPLAVFEIRHYLKNTDLGGQTLMSAMITTNARYGILTDNNDFYLFHKTKEINVCNLSFEEIVEHLINPEIIKIQRSDIELVQKLIKKAATIHLQDHQKFLGFINAISFDGKINFDQNNRKFYFSDSEGIDSFENKLFNELFGEFKESQICRYTSLHTVFEMLKNLSFRMSGIVGMNDRSEVNYVDSYFTRKDNLINITKPIIKEHHNTISALNNRYITSCSTKERIDDLTLWRLYADDAKGVCLVYDVKKNNLNKHALLQKVKYAEVQNGLEYHKALEFLYQIMIDVGKETGLDFEFRQLAYWKHFFKPHDYSIEDEVRLLIIDDKSLPKHNDDWVLTSTHSILNPVMDFKLNSNSFPIHLKEIILGPKCPEQETNFVQLQEMIRRKKKGGNLDSNLTDLKVRLSKINHYR